MSAIAKVHVEAFHSQRQFRVETEHVTRDFDPHRRALHEIDRSRHGAEMDTLRGGALLNIVHIALERFREVARRPRPVGTRQHPCMNHAGQGRSVGRAGVVVGDLSRNRGRVERIAQTPEQFAELFGRKQIKQHQGIRLFRCLVAVGAVVLRFENQFEAADVAVPYAIVLPIQLGELFVALELADDSVVMKRHIHPTADLVPADDLFLRQCQPRHERFATHVWEQVEHLQRPPQHPHGHDVGIGVVLQAGRR